MATTAGDGMAPSESSGAGQKFQNSTGMSSDQGGNSTSIFATTGKSELKQTLKQLAFTRFKIQHPTTMEDLPDEILINIFIGLLARQLAQMRIVSKSWNGLLSHPSFVKSHLHLSILNKNNQVFLITPGCYKKPYIEYSCQSTHLELTNFIKHTTPNNIVYVIGSVNGLICFSGHSYPNIHIWNPSLSAVSAIPPPHSLISIYISRLNEMRFGFDPKTDDYKLVKISGKRDRGRVKEWMEVEVYSMRKGSWKFITQQIPSHITMICNSDHVCVDGHDGRLHWQTKTVVETEETILAFDLGLERFCEIPLPDSILDSTYEMHRLGVLDGKLCEMTWCIDGAWEVWVMEEYGVPESWAKHLVFSKFICDWRFPYGFTSRSELLLEDKYGRLVLYDPIANETKSTTTIQRAVRIVEYVDSLVWI